MTQKKTPTPKTRKSDDQKTAAERRKQRRQSRQKGASDVTADWAEADAELVLRLIAAATEAGEVITFGYTRDGNTYTVSIYDWNDRFVEYCRPTEDLKYFLEMLLQDYE